MLSAPSPIVGGVGTLKACNATVVKGALPQVDGVTEYDTRTALEGWVERGQRRRNLSGLASIRRPALSI